MKYDLFDPTQPGFYDRPGMLTPAQIRRILKPVAADRIEVKQSLSYVPQQEVRAELTRTFGAGNWDSQVESQELLYEGQQEGTTDKTKGKQYWVVAYKVSVRLNIRDYWGRPVASFIEYHVEENAPQPNRGEAHVLALTSAASYALRRAAIGIGDNMGLHLYNKGSHAPLIIGTIQLAGDRQAALAPSDAEIAEAEAKRTAGAPAAQAAPEQPAVDPAAAAGAQSALQAGFAHPDARA